MANLSPAEKAGYSAGEFGGSGFWQILMIFLPIFLTDTFGLEAAAVSTLFLLVRIIDAVTDPLMGVIADRTATRWGHFRPYLLWVAVPFSLCALALFWAPDLSPGGRLGYAYATYILMMLLYTAIMIPFSALSGVMTSDPTDRTSLNTYRFVGAFIAALIVKTNYQPAVHFFGGGGEGPMDPVLGNRWALGLFGLFATVFFLLAFASTRERVASEKKPGQNLATDVLDLARNFPWVIILIVSLATLIFICIKGSVTTYYFKYFFAREDLLPTFLFASSLATLAGTACASWLGRRFEKRTLLLACYGLSSVLGCLIWVVQPGQVSLLFALEIASALLFGPVMPILWSMMADAADYSAWRTGRRATGLVFSASTLAFKAGVAIGGFIALRVLANSGYLPNQDQPAAVLSALRHMMSTYYAAGGLVCVAALLFYPLTRRRLEQIEADLRQRSQAQP